MKIGPPKGKDLFLKDKEEFSRIDPDKTHKVYWLSILNWILPISLVLVGLFVTTQKFATLMNYDEKIVGVPFYTLSSGYRIYNPLVFLLGILKYAFNDVYSFYFFKAVPPVFLSLCLAVLSFVFLSIICNAHQRNQHVHGTSRWGEKKDLVKFGFLQRYGVVCGELNNAPVVYSIGGENHDKLILHLKNPFFNKYILKEQPRVAPLVCHSGATNTWVIAPTRSGKGVSCVIPTCLNYGIPYWSWKYNKNSFFYNAFDGVFKNFARLEKIIKGKGSMVIFDPKAENYEASAGYRSMFSTILPFNPMQINDSKGKPIGTVHYNPIHEIPDDEKNSFAWADIFGQFFFDGKAASGDNAFFYKNARDIFTAVLLHVRFSANIPKNEKTFTKILQLFSIASHGEESDDEESTCGKAMINEMQSSGIHIHDDGSEFPSIHQLIYEAADRSMYQMTEKERASVYSTVFSEINYFQDPLIKEVTSYCDFSVKDFITSKNGISLYLIIPYNHLKRISPLFRLIVNFIIRIFSEGATNANSQKLSIPCLFLLDEFPAMGKFDDIEENAGVLAGYGVTFFIISQSLNQIEKIYTDKHAFLDHCKTVILYTPGNYKDAKSFSDAIGNRSVLLDNISASGNKFQAGFSNVSRGSQEISTSLINPDELMKLDFSRAIIMNQGMPPYKAKKVVYYEDPRFKNKAFLPYPSIKTILKKASVLPSNSMKKNITTKADFRLIKVQSVDVKNELRSEKIIDGNFDIFNNVGA